MPTLFVSSVDGNNGDDGLSWANAKATVAGAFAIAVDPTNIIYVDSAHSFTANAAISWAPSANTWASVISVNRGTGAHLAGAVESVGAANAAFTLSAAGAGSGMYVEGMTLNGGTTAGTAADIMLMNGNETQYLTMVNCTMNINNTNVGSCFGLTSVQTTREFRNCTFMPANSTGTTPSFNTAAGNNLFIGCTIAVAASVPTTLMNPGVGGQIRWIDCDLSAFSGANLCNVGNAPLMSSETEFVNCKLHASTVNPVTGTWQAFSRGSVALINCDASDTHNTYSHNTRAGAITRTTTVYADSGAEFDATPVGWQIVTTADCSEERPFVTPWLACWNSDTATPDFSLEFVHDSGTDLDDRECWAEFEYLDNASFPLGTVVSTRNADPFDGTGVDLDNSAQTWTGTGGFGASNEQQIVRSLTPAEKSVVRARLFVAVASKTLYLDPQLRITA